MSIIDSAAANKSLIPVANAIELIAGIAANLSGSTTAKYIGENQLTFSRLRDMAAANLREALMTKKVG